MWVSTRPANAHPRRDEHWLAPSRDLLSSSTGEKICRPLRECENTSGDWLRLDLQKEEPFATELQLRVLLYEQDIE